MRLTTKPTPNIMLSRQLPTLQRRNRRYKRNQTNRLTNQTNDTNQTFITSNRQTQRPSKHKHTSFMQRTTRPISTNSTLRLPMPLFPRLSILSNNTNANTNTSRTHDLNRGSHHKPLHNNTHPIYTLLSNTLQPTRSHLIN